MSEIVESHIGEFRCVPHRVPQMLDLHERHVSLAPRKHERRVFNSLEPAEYSNAARPSARCERPVFVAASDTRPDAKSTASHRNVNASCSRQPESRRKRNAAIAQGFAGRISRSEPFHFASLRTSRA